MILTTWHSGKGETGDSKKFCGFHGFEGERVTNRQSTESLAQWNSSLWFRNGGYRSINLSKPTKCTTKRLKPHVNCGFRVMMMWQKYLTGVWREVGEGGGLMWKHCTLSSTLLWTYLNTENTRTHTLSFTLCWFSSYSLTGQLHPPVLDFFFIPIYINQPEGANIS